MESDNAVELLSDLDAIDPDLKESLINALPKKKAAYLRLRLSYRRRYSWFYNELMSIYHS